MVRLNVTLSSDLSRKLDQIAEESSQSKSEILRKALTLFEVAREGRAEGKKLTLVDSKAGTTTEIIGL